MKWQINIVQHTSGGYWMLDVKNGGELVFDFNGSLEACLDWARRIVREPPEEWLRRMVAELEAAQAALARLRQRVADLEEELLQQK